MNAKVNIIMDSTSDLKVIEEAAKILAIQLMALGCDGLMDKMVQFKEDLKEKIVKANQELSEVKFKFKTN